MQNFAGNVGKEPAEIKLTKRAGSQIIYNNFSSDFINALQLNFLNVTNPLKQIGIGTSDLNLM